VIDDGEQAAEALGKLLTLQGHKVRLAFDGRSGIAMAKRFEPEIVMLDLKLPDMTGFEALTALQQLPALTETRFIAMTGQQNVEETMAAGFDRHITKPVDIAALNAWLAQL
jgi:CheY-like chemotaxis protein